MDEADASENVHGKTPVKTSVVDSMPKTLSSHNTVDSRAPLQAFPYPIVLSTASAART
jgi:chemotaxis response regulator CheB